MSAYQKFLFVYMVAHSVSPVEKEYINGAFDRTHPYFVYSTLSLSLPTAVHNVR